MPGYQFYWGADKHFCVDKFSVKELVKKYGTPLNIISEKQVLANLHRLKRSFADGWQGEVRVLPAIKSNTSYSLCRILAKETGGCDLFSEGELKAALDAGFSPQELSLNGNNKLTLDMGFLRYAIEQGVRITLDDQSEFEPIESIAKKMNKKVLVRFRVRPKFSKMNQTSDFVHEGPLSSEMAAFVYKAGIPTEDLVPLGKRALNSDWLELTGLHLHLGRHRKDLSFWEAGMKGYAALIQQLKKSWNGWEPKEIDIGGGFAQHLDPFKSYNEDSAMRLELRLMNTINRVAGLLGDSIRYKILSMLIKASHKKILTESGPDFEKNTMPSIEEYGQMAQVLRDELQKRGIDTEKIVLELEPGRSLFGNAEIHVSRVSFIKQQTSPIPWRWVVTDTTEYWLLGANNPQNQPYLVDTKPIDQYSVQNRIVADIAGKSCGPDRITGDACLPGDTSPGDLIVWVGTGAYQEMQSSNFNSMGRPATVLVNGDQEGLIRRRETIDDVFDRELIAGWL